MPRYIISVDQSTIATKAFVFDEQARKRGRFDITHRQIHPKPGWVEHSLNEIYGNTLKAVDGVLKQTGIRHSEIACISLSNQRETTAVWDENGPVHNAVVWQCPRAQSIIERPEFMQNAERVFQASGLRLSPYFSAAKAKWIAEDAQINGNAYFGTIDSWLIWKLTGEHVTDYSNASRTQLFNINTLKWDDELIGLFSLKCLRLPELRDADTVIGYTDLDGILEEKIPLAGVLGDSHAALFAQQCWQKGMGKATFGTGSSVMLNIGAAPILSQRGLSTSIAWRMSGKAEYVFEGNINSSGDTIKWLREELGLIDEIGQAEEFARSVSSSGGVYLVPAFVGLGAPHWRADARAIISGLSRDSNKYHIVRAGLESMVYQIKDVLLPMQSEADVRIGELRVDGGPSKNGFLMQFAADQLGTRIVKSNLDELSALGAAYAGGIACGLWKNRNALSAFWQPEVVYERQMPQCKIDEDYQGWRMAVAKLL